PAAGAVGEAPAAGAVGEAAAAGRAKVRTGGEPTLDALLSGVWEGLAAHAPVSCPLCEGEMRPSYGAHHRPVAGRCTHCGTEIS
ncbi:MAG: hypothetical protein ACYC0H_23970, partial [Solirubrobacteraceae bacterium]